MGALTWGFGLAFGVGLLGVASPAPASASASAASGAEIAVRAASAEEVRDFMAADAAGLARLWSEGFVVTNPLNRFVTGPEVLDMVRSGVLRFTSYDRRTEYVRLYGDIAVLAGAETVVWAGRMPMAGKLSHLRFTAVWRFSGGAWREVARHANIVPDP